MHVTMLRLSFAYAIFFILHFTFKNSHLYLHLNLHLNLQGCMHVTMLRLSFAYAIFTTPLVPAHLFDNTSDNSLKMTPFRVGFENTVFDEMHHSGLSTQVT